MTTVPEQVRGLANVYGRGSRAYAAVLDPTLEEMARNTVEIAGLSTRHCVLDLACGTGTIARAAKTRARVVAVDLSFGMMTTARRLSPRSILFILAHAAFLPFTARTFDAITCGLSVSHFTDVHAVLIEVRRTLRPGGVFVASSWGSSGADPSYSAVFSVYKQYMGNLPRPFSSLLDEKTWSDPARALEIIGCSGFVSAQVTTRTLAGVYSTPAAAVEWALAWPLTAGGLDQLKPARRKALRADALAAVESANDLQWHRDVHYYRATAARATT